MSLFPEAATTRGREELETSHNLSVYGIPAEEPCLGIRSPPGNATATGDPQR